MIQQEVIGCLCTRRMGVTVSGVQLFISLTQRLFNKFVLVKMPLISKCVDDFKHYVICVDAIIGKYMVHGDQYRPFCHAWQTSRHWPLRIISPKVHDLTTVILCRSESVIQFIYLGMLRQIRCRNMHKIVTLSDNDFSRRSDVFLQDLD